MTDTTWEDALETVMVHLEDPPHPESPAGEAFDEALRRLLAAASSAGRQPPSDGGAAPILDESLRVRLDDLARRRKPAHPFGDYPEGIGPTLGMDLSKS